MLLGNPSGATPDPADRDNYLMAKPHYALSYNNSRGTPNWVTWRVTRADLGDAPRKWEFDPELAAVGAASRVIAVVMPNQETGIGGDWTAYRTSAAEVERRTGYRFFERLAPEVAEALRRRVNQTPVEPARRSGGGR
jgi:DNA/RNA endonuclease G (NUC1)